MRFGIKITENISPASREILRSHRSPEPVIAIARGVAGETRNFYAGLEKSRPNRRGFPRQHFWSAVRRSVNQPVVINPALAQVNITHPHLLQRIRGGYLRPKPGRKYLTLPNRADAYGKRAREFHNLHFGFAENQYGNLAPALIENNAQRVAFGRRRKDGSRKVTPGAEYGGDAVYFLIRKVYQRPDPTAFPSEALLKAAATKAADEYAQKLVDRVNRTPAPPKP